MAQTTITLSFDISAKVPDDLPGVEAVRSCLEDGLPDDWWNPAVDTWWLQHINTTPPQHQPVNDELLRQARHMLTRLELEAQTVKIFPGAAMVPDLRAAVDAVTRAKIDGPGSGVCCAGARVTESEVICEHHGRRPLH